MSSSHPARARNSSSNSWTCVYPIYIDAKRPHKNGERRIAKRHAVQWPLIHDMSNAANRLGLSSVLEVRPLPAVWPKLTRAQMNKRHPRDWENPGRLKVLLKQDGKHLHPVIQDSAPASFSSDAPRIQVQNIPFCNALAPSFENCSGKEASRSMEQASRRRTTTDYLTTRQLILTACSRKRSRIRRRYLGWRVRSRIRRRRNCLCRRDRR